ncbi:MAG TPA: hypothetical protein VNL16_07860 [Chloroflexota bacterium]|nr:hypothetical protein [Chloroflexota bacterium]
MTIGIQDVLGVAALVGGVYAGYDLLFGVPSWKAAAARVIARVWVCVLLVTVGVDQIVFGQNAVLQVGYLLGLPLLAVQIGFILSLVVALYGWSGG